MPTPSTNADKTPVAPTNRTVVASADKPTVAPANKADKAAVTPAHKTAVASADETAFALASEVGLGFSPGNKTHRQIGALAPEVCLPIPRKTTRFNRYKFLLPLALAATLITSCEPPKPTPKTTTDNLRLTTCN